MKTVKLLKPTMVDTVIHDAGKIVLVPDDLARNMVGSASGEVVDSGDVVNMESACLAEVVSPTIANQDPLHAARNLSSNVEDHPGLIAAADLGVPGAPKRSGRMVPAEVVVTPPEPVMKSKGK